MALSRPQRTLSSATLPLSSASFLPLSLRKLRAGRLPLVDRERFPPATSSNAPSVPQLTQQQSAPDCVSLAWDTRIPSRAIQQASQIISPLVASAWSRLLVAHSNRPLVERLVDGIVHGVDVHFRGPRRQSPRLSINQPSANAQAAQVSADIEAEVAAGRKAGPFDVPPFLGFVCSPLGAVPKKNGKVRIVHNLSWPIGASVNTHIEHLDCLLVSFDAAMDLVVQQGRGCLLTKVDIKSAYKCIPVRAADWPLLGLRWRGKFYFDKTLPFGLGSSCAIWEDYATTAQWIVLHHTSVRRLCHYVDDYLVVSDPSAAKRESSEVLAIFSELGLPVALDKLEGPTTSLVFLGLLVDTVAMTVSLDSARLQQLCAAAAEWSVRRVCSRNELQSLVGVLCFAARVVRPARTFTRHALSLLSATHGRPASASITLSDGFRSDMRWWHAFLPKWNGVGLLYDSAWSSCESLGLWTDASTLGYGAIFGHHWFSCAWSAEERVLAARAQRESMPWMELYCVVRAAATWGDQWRGRRVTFHVDALSIVGAIHAGTSASEPIMALIRSLFFVSACAGFEFRVLHTPGDCNTLADPLSRLQVATFKQRCPEADASPTTPLPVPTPAF